MTAMPVLTPLLASDLFTADPVEPPSGGRDPAHALYDEAAGLLATAHALEAAAREPEAVAALAPTLACIETALDALRRVSEQLRDQALVRLSAPVLPHDDLRRRRAEIALQFGRLAGVLEQSTLACKQARRSIAPVVAELTAI
jgi:hypothetical protein